MGVIFKVGVTGDGAQAGVCGPEPHYAVRGGEKTVCRAVRMENRVAAQCLRRHEDTEFISVSRRLRTYGCRTG